MSVITLVSSLFGLGSEWVKGKSEEKKEKLITKREENRAKAESNNQREANITKTETNLASLDAITLRQIGYLDDLVVILTMSCVVMGFIPFTAEYVNDGLNALSVAPEWFKWCVGAVYVYVLGFKSLVYRLLVKRGV